MSRHPAKRPLGFRSVFIPDVHLGCRGSRTHAGLRMGSGDTAIPG